MTSVCVSFLLVSENAFALSSVVGYVVALGVALLSLILFGLWSRKESKLKEKI